LRAVAAASIGPVEPSGRLLAGGVELLEVGHQIVDALVVLKPG
jgi:hypothetical protein